MTRASDPEFLDLVLSTKFEVYQSEGAVTLTVREYFRDLLRRLWDEGEGFSGKRPYGDSGWWSDIWVGMVKAGIFEGTLDEDGYPESDPPDDYDDIVLACIGRL